MDDLHNKVKSHKKIQDIAEYDGEYQHNFEKNHQSLSHLLWSRRLVSLLATCMRARALCMLARGGLGGSAAK